MEVRILAVGDVCGEPGMAFLTNRLKPYIKENDIAFTVVGDYADDAIKVIEDNQKRLGYQKLECEKGVAKVSVVGAGMMSNPGVAAKMFECLYNSNINIKMISTSEIRVTVLIDEKEVERAMNAAHEIFGLDEA